MTWRSALTRASAMAASPGPNQNALSNSPRRAAAATGSCALPSSSASTGLSLSSDCDETVVDDRGKVFSAMALQESAAAAAARTSPTAALRRSSPTSGQRSSFASSRATAANFASSSPSAPNLSITPGDLQPGDGRCDLFAQFWDVGAGEVSLPGGKADEGDADDRETA
ncbi:hypothetical protein C4D60_Mb01t30960 [Musa balbisiana]|uniref:Nudix hydrolase domain-containing protein n=1 Tax=Musa balbisiana TaxID=52838 RepID=A0A4S8JS14_MUSBA|nr:hypothetical protein C4D60_Mb01t30960 [Musa balbisiana]